MDRKDYSAVMAANGRKGGIAKGKAYEKTVHKIINAFVNTELTQQEIALKFGVSQAMVNKYVNKDLLKIMRLEKRSVSKLFTDEEISKVLDKIKLEEELKTFGRKRQKKLKV